MELNNYPDSKNLVGPIKEKAIDLANALLEEGYEEGRAISIGISQAKKWVGDESPTMSFTDRTERLKNSKFLRCKEEVIQCFTRLKS